MKILIIQLRRIGDILLTTPVISYLKENLPDSTLHFLSEPVGKMVLETHPQIDRLLLYDRARSWDMIKMVRAERYDVVFDFMNNPRTGYLTLLSSARHRVGWKHPVRRFFYNTPIEVPPLPEYVPLRKLRMVESWLRKQHLLKAEPLFIRPQLFLSDEDNRAATEWMKKEGLAPGRFGIFAPASRYQIRMWKKEGVRRVALEILKRHGVKSYLAWGPGEEGVMAEIRKGVEDKIGLLPPTTMRQMAAIFKPAAFVFSSDAGPMHTAVAVGTPTVTVYGPTRPVDWNPSLADGGKKDIPLNVAELECLGCHLHECPIGNPCMKDLSEARVLDACEKLLAGGK